MGRFKYVLEIEVERETGKFAGRDEIAGKIEEALGEVESNLDIRGIGADSSSDYEVTGFEFTEYSDKEMKAFWKENDTEVSTGLPTKTEATQTIRELKAQLKERDTKIGRLERQLEARQAEELEGATRIYTEDSAFRHGESPVRQYLPDDQYDYVYFDMPLRENAHERDYSRLQIGISPHDGHLVVRSETNSIGGIVVMPMSNNQIAISVADARTR